eukprot:345802_1
MIPTFKKPKQACIKVLFNAIYGRDSNEIFSIVSDNTSYDMGSNNIMFGDDNWTVYHALLYRITHYEFSKTKDIFNMLIHYNVGGLYAKCPGNALCVSLRDKIYEDRNNRAQYNVQFSGKNCLQTAKDYGKALVKAHYPQNQIKKLIQFITLIQNQSNTYCNKITTVQSFKINHELEDLVPSLSPE